MSFKLADVAAIREKLLADLGEKEQPMSSITDQEVEDAPDTSELETESEKEPEAEAKAKETTTTDVPATDETTDGGGEAEDQEAESGSQHRVPYKRFRSVIDERNAARQEAQQKAQELENLRAELERARQAGTSRREETTDETDDAWLKELLADEDQETGGQTPKQLEQLMARVNRIEMERAKLTLDQEVAEVRATYPDVPVNVLYEAVVRNNKADLKKVGLAYTNHVNELKEQAIADYLKENPPQEKPAAKPRVAPRPGATGGSGATSSGKAKTIREASANVREMLRARMR